jgi:ribosome biogenesis GTPase / thiamine phosphate phosphatase
VASEHPGTEVVAVSSRTGHGIQALARSLGRHTVVLLGESGAGKSSLLNALAGEEVALTGDVREVDAKGRHTTTRRELHLLPGGGIVVDTPGIRAIGLYADPDAIDAAFPDIEERASDCRFADCTHDHEPGCAVRAAVEAGELAPARLAAYHELHAEAEWAMRPDHERRGRRR